MVVVHKQKVCVYGKCSPDLSRLIFRTTCVRSPLSPLGPIEEKRRDCALILPETFPFECGYKVRYYLLLATGPLKIQLRT